MSYLSKVAKKPRELVQSRNFSKAIGLLKSIPRNSALIENISDLIDQPSFQAQVLDDWISTIVESNIPVKTYRVRPNVPRCLTSDLKRLVSLKNRYIVVLYFYPSSQPMVAVQKVWQLCASSAKNS